MAFIDFSLKPRGVKLFKPLRLALMTSTPFTDEVLRRSDATPVNRTAPFPFKPRVIKNSNPTLDATKSFAGAPTPVETKTTPTQTPKRINPLTAMRQLQKRGIVRLDLIRREEDENKNQNQTTITRSKPKLIKAAGVVVADSERRFYADDGTYVDLAAPVLSATDNPGKEKRARPESGIQKYTHYNDGSEDGRKREKPVSLSSGVGFIFDKEIWSVEDCDIIPARNKCRGDAHTHSGLFCEAVTASGKAYCSSCSSRYFAKNSSQLRSTPKEQIKLDEENRKTRQEINSLQDDARLKAYDDIAEIPEAAE